MTVRELIEKLLTLPQEAPVLVSSCSEHPEEIFETSVETMRVNRRSGHWDRFPLSRGGSAVVIIAG